jgi:uncharacterized membrane protein
MMNQKKLPVYQIIFAAIILSFMLLWAILLGDLIILVAAIITGIGFTIILSRKDEKVQTDERIQLINEKASTLTLQIFVLATTSLGFFLLALGSIGYAELSQFGFTLVYLSCALIILNMIFIAYYRRKYGG